MPRFAHELHLTSDMHFSHLNAATKFRGFRSVEEHDEFLVERWNNAVRPGDRVIILGDACMGTITESIQIIGRLNGEKWLMPGNHDWLHPAHHGRVDALAKGQTRKVHEKEALYFEAFDRILPLQMHRNMQECDPIDAAITLCHFPPFGDHTAEERFEEFRPSDFGQMFLHGHVHDLWQTNDDNRLVNVGVDVWGFAPVALSTIEAL